MPELRPFLTAEWRYVLILNYEIAPAVLEPYLPPGTELDLYDGVALASMVGFLFQKARLLGLPIPFHTHFEEVNLRFYVRYPAGGETRRGVVFIKEIVPLPWIARVARWVYRERYIALPMTHHIEEKNNQLSPDGLVEYAWRHRGRLNRLGGLATGEPAPLKPGSEEEFIAEHYWGYTRLNPRRASEYYVSHPTWQVWQVAQPYLLSDIKSLYGSAFEPYLHRRPRSAFLAEGSPVEIFPARKL